MSTHFLINGYSRNRKKNFYKFFLNDTDFYKVCNEQIYAKGMIVQAMHNVEVVRIVPFTLKGSNTINELFVTIGDTILDIKREIRTLLGSSIKLNKILVMSDITNEVLADYKHLVEEGKIRVYLNLGANSIEFKINPRFKID